MVTVGNCCYCFELRMGSLIIGWLQLVLPGLNIAADVVAKFRKNATDNAISDVVANSKGFWGDVVVNSFHIVMALCLLYGVYANRKVFVYYYVFIEAVLIGTRILIVVVLLIMAAYSHVALTIVIALITWSFLIYWLIVVYSYYHEMSD